ncbi:competence/damage-inducible protein A [[Clostridium] fimetarium]|uniref:Putative competence-damage inducible protein n=1 Tax=[Clostridium] fimetarium TaxID=99656 RepID=A0A1I0PZL6_9FIRM|nr:competence/damage-inducible protein A [[Clostridium] fimetarium]SEW19918.1 nicotinamide-nucleotide amidase [[Clostridium] fimetarium]
MVAELISVGTEILLGNIVNTNAAYLSEKCASFGLSLYNQQVVGDNEDRLADALKVAIERSDIVILSGGLGPTQDDLTKEVTAKVMGCELIEDAHSKDHIISMLKSFALKENITENNWKQAFVPKGAIIMENHNGTAPGIIIEKDGKSIILLPGPPNEMIPMFEESVTVYLNKLQPEILYSMMVKICGVGESKVETLVLDLINGQTNPTIATYAKTGEAHIRITAKAKNLGSAKKMVEPIVETLKDRFKDNIYSTNENEELEDVVVKELINKKLQVVTVESCTGGLLAGRLINVSGVSQVLKQGFITYANESKMKLVNVNESTLKQFGAVSKEVAIEMAKGGIIEADADIGIAITGIAGPNAEEDKPVGLVYIACCYKDNVVVKEYNFNGNRQKVRDQSVTKALDLLRRCLK